MSYQTIQDKVVRLYKAGARRIVLSEIDQRPAIPAVKGRAVYNDPAETVSNDRDAVIVVYSQIVLTEDGAFEMPPDWPGDGGYPSGAVMPSGSQTSLISSGGGIALDTGVQYYQQLRAHLVVRQQGEIASQEAEIVRIQPPFSGSYYGLTAATEFRPNFYMVTKPGMNDAAAAIYNQLASAGIELI